MSTHQIFESLIMPELLSIAREVGVLESILCISLYGSANYGWYDKNVQIEKHLGESDYDIWILFKRGHFKESQVFASKLFKKTFILPNNYLKSYILYDKLRQQIGHEKFLIAPMIVMEESYDLLKEDEKKSSVTISIPWYRSMPRERSTKVPICFTDFNWLEIDMQQIHVIEANIWKLQMPVIVKQKERIALGTFLECVFSGDCFYGNYERADVLKRMLFLDSIRHLRFEKTMTVDKIPSKMYQMLTLNSKAGPAFKERKVQQFSQWLSI
jgi:hypothetical protein